jgi:hypothetical protein
LISDAQLILGFSRHLTAYSVSRVHAELEFAALNSNRWLDLGRPICAGDLD